MSVPQNRQLVKGQQRKAEELEAQRQQATANHEAYVDLLKRTILGKLVLVGVNQQGISRSFVTDIVGDMTGAIAIALSTDKQAGEMGMYMDIRQLVFYKTYTDEEAEAWLKKNEEDMTKQKEIVKVMASPVVGGLTPPI